MTGGVTKLISSFAAVAAIGLSQQAQAVTQNLGALVAPQSVTFGNTITGTGVAFQDDYLFTLTPDATFSSITLSIDLTGGVFSIDPGSFTSQLWSGGQLIAAATTSFVNGGAQALIQSLSIAAGSYDLRVLGTTTGSAGGSYFGNMNVVVNPVPEPETYAMLMAGLGLLGFMARRRNGAMAAA